MTVAGFRFFGEDEMAVVPFEFENVSVRVVVDEAGEPMFVAKDVAEVLGYTNSNKAMADHCKGVTKRYPLSTAGGIQEVRVIYEPDVYRLVMRSKLPSAEAFEKKVFEEILPAIRKTGGYGKATNKEAIQGHLSDKAQAGAIAARFLIEQLNLEGSARLGMLTQYTKAYAVELLPSVPVYAVDAPPSSVDGSSKPTKSATEMLKEFKSPVSAKAFNQLAEKAGYLEHLERPSSHGETKKFWSVTDAGQEYGKNVTSPQSQRETQPHWYIDRFAGLLIELGIVADDLND